MTAYLVYTPEILIMISALLALLFDALDSKKLAGGIAIILNLVALVIILGWSGITGSILSLPQSGGHGLFYFSLFGYMFQIIFIIVTVSVELTTLDFSEYNGIFYALIEFALTGMMIVAISGDMVILILGLELAGISTYILTGYIRKSELSVEAAMKYYIIGSISSSLTIFGLSILYGVTGTTSLWLLNLHAGYSYIPKNNPLLYLGFSFIIAGLGFKIAMAPFHMWAPDVYQGAPSPVSAFLAAGSKTMGFMAMFIIFLSAIFYFAPNLSLLFGFFAILTMTTGNILAIKQRNIKRMLAYSSIANAGYILIAFSVDTPLAVAGGMFQIFSHAIMKVGAFIVVAVVSVFGVGESITDYKGLAKEHSLLALSFAIMLLSLAGVPPLMGFMSKFVLFSGAVQAGGWYILLAIAGVLNSALSLYYYARIVKYMYIDNPEPGKHKNKKISMPIYSYISIFVLVVIIVAVGIYPSPIIGYFIHIASQNMVWR